MDKQPQKGQPAGKMIAIDPKKGRVAKIGYAMEEIALEKLSR